MKNANFHFQTSLMTAASVFTPYELTTERQFPGPSSSLGFHTEEIGLTAKTSVLMNLKFSLQIFPNRGTGKQESKHHQLCVSEFFWKNLSKSGRNLAGQACTKLLLGHAHHSPAGRERLSLVPEHYGPKLSEREQQGGLRRQKPPRRI